MTHVKRPIGRDVNIDKQRILKAFDIVSEGSDYLTTVSNTATLLAYIVNEAERITPHTPRRFEAIAMSDMLPRPYKVICEEQEKEN